MNAERSFAASSAVDGVRAPLVSSEVAQTRTDTCFASNANDRVDLCKRPPAPVPHAVKDALHLTRQADFIAFRVVGCSVEEWRRDYCTGLPPGWICIAPIAVGVVKKGALRVVHFCVLPPTERAPRHPTAYMVNVLVIVKPS